MKLHIFNPEHDIALAFGGKYFTAPRAGRRLRHDLCYLPVLWADDGDCILVDDAEYACVEAARLPVMLPDVRFVTLPELSSLADNSDLLRVSSWGWDAAIAFQLLKHGVPERLLPSESQLSAIRDVSSRRWAAANLGNSGVYCETVEELRGWAERFGRFVLKAPWSSSGRGVRYKEDWSWAAKIIEQQGGIMIDPFFDTELDFGMEFHSTVEGEIVYDGLSLFDTSNGAYVGNVLACEEEKERMLCRYVPIEVLHEARQNILSKMTHAIRNIYVGPFGVDMMVCRDKGRWKLVSCVELNLRCTMGHVANYLYNRLRPDFKKRTCTMKVRFYNGRYHLDIHQCN